MFSQLTDINCPLCGSGRAPDLRQPCRKCGARNRFLLGYAYPHEAGAFFRVLLIVLLALLALLVVGGLYLYNAFVVVGA